MKYAALIFGDDERPPKAASVKLSSPEPGQVVRNIDGSVYRVASKLASPDGTVVKLSSLRGEPVQTPLNFRPVSFATARFASWLKYHLAYNRDFDLYVNAYIEKYNEQHPDKPLPYPVGRDGKPFRWANWFQKTVSPKLYTSGSRGEDSQRIKDEAIHEMLFTVLGQRDVLSQFATKMKSLGVTGQSAGHKLTDFLVSSFMYRIQEMQTKINNENPRFGDKFQRQIRYQRELYNEAKNKNDRAGMAAASKKIKELEAELEGMGEKAETPVEFSLWTPTEESGDEESGDILEQEQYGVTDKGFESADARRDVAKFRDGFKKWLDQTEGQGPAENVITMFDLFWDALQDSEDVKRGDIEQAWLDKTGLSFGAFMSYFSRLPEMVERYIESHRRELGDNHIFVELMNAIKEERGQGETKKQREREQARPAMVSSLHTAGVEEDFAEANKAVVSPLKEATAQVEECPGCLQPAKVENGKFVTHTTRNSKSWCFNSGKIAGGTKRLHVDEMIRREQLLKSIRPGDRVTIMIPAGMGREGQEWKEATGRAVIVSPDRVALNMGGKYGTPGVATVDNIVSVRKAKQSADFDFQQELADEAWLDSISEKEDEAMAHFLGDEQMQQAALEAGMSMEQLWEEIKQEYSNEYWGDRVASAKTAQRKTAQKLLRGDELDPSMRDQVLRAFIYRWTSDNKRRGDVYHCDKCDVRQNPYINEQSAEGHQHPTIPLQTDEQWLADHAFHFTNAGRLMPHRHAEPAYLVQQKEDQTLLASVATKFAMEKAAYNPGMAEYIYQADTYCEHCAEAVKRLLRQKGQVPANPEDEASYDSDQYPKGPFYQQEADTPQFCANCGKFLENPLTQAGYEYLNQMILEHDEDGSGQSDIIDELKAFYPEREEDTEADEIDNALEMVERDTDKDFLRGMNTSSLKKADYACCGGKGSHKDDCSVKDTDSTSKHTAMIPHEFNDADGQAIRNETMPDTGREPHVYDSTEFKQPRVGADEEDDPMLVAKTILEQLGGNKFRAMTGAKNFVGGRDNLTFRLPGAGGFTKDGINAVQITLDPSDTYTVAFSRIRGGVPKVISMHRDVYAENLREVFEKATGLYTSLGTMGKRGDFAPTTPQEELDVIRGDRGQARERGLNVSESMQKPWWCMDCNTTVDLDQQGRCENCGGEAVDVASHGKSTPERKYDLEGNPNIGPRMSAEYEKSTCSHCGGEIYKPFPQGGPWYHSDTHAERCGKSGVLRTQKPTYATPKTAQGSGNTTVTMQNQNVTNPNVPGKAEPMAVSEAIDQQAGPHSPNAPMTAPRTPGITPKIVNVPPGTEGGPGEATASKTAKYNGWFDIEHGNEFACPFCAAQLAVGNWNTEYGDAQPGDYEVECPDCGKEFPLTVGVSTTYKTGAADETDIECPKCHGTNVDIDAPDPETYRIYCEDCEEVTYDGGTVTSSPRRGMPGDEFNQLEQMSQMEGEIPEGPEPDWDAEYEAHRLDQMDKQGAGEEDIYRELEEEGRQDKELSESIEVDREFESTLALPQPEKEEWLFAHGWKKDQEWHGASWWMQKPMWSRTDHEEDIPYQDTDDAIEKEFDLMERESGHTHEAAGSNSGQDDVRGVGDLYRENFYEHRTEGLSSDGMLSGMKEGANKCCPLADSPSHDTVLKLAEAFKAGGKDAANELAKTLIPPKTQRWVGLAIVDAVMEHARSKSAAAPTVAPGANIHPNVQQQIDLAQGEAAQQAQGGPVIALTPNQSAPEQPEREKHTVEPELPNARYHMMGQLASEEEDRMLAQDPEYPQWLDTLKAEGVPCEECGEVKPDVEWRVSEDFSDASDPTKPAAGWLCEDCDLNLAQDI